MTVSLIAAVSSNGVIGRDGDMPWRLSSDLQRFKRLTMGHHIIMGRKTFDSIGRLLPGRTTVIISRQPDFQVDGALMANSIEQAMAYAANDEQPFITGGGQIYAVALPLVTRIFLTRVHTEIDGDTYFPEINWDLWNCVDKSDHIADDKNNFDYSFETYERIH